MRIILAAVLVALLSGCIGSGIVKPTPEVMEKNGVVVFQLQEYPTIAGLLKAKIDGTLHYTFGGETTFIVLEPGTHTLTAFVAEELAGNLTKFTTYRTERRFEVKAGQATSLGTAVLETLPSDQYRVSWWRDQTRIIANINAKYPHLLAGGKRPDVAPGKYPDEKALKAFRRYVATKEIGERAARSGYVGSIVGTLAKYRKDGKGGIASLQLMDTGTLAHLFGCRETASGAICMVPDGSTVLVTDGRTVEYASLPAGFDWASIYVRGGDEIVATDKLINVALSHDGGRSWTTHTQYHLQSDPANLGYARGKKGLYIYSRYVDGTVLYIPDGSSEIRKIPVSDKADYLSGVLETDAGLFVGPEYTMITDSVLYFRAQGASNWTEYVIPKSSCKGLKEIAGGVLQVECSRTLMYSKDGGKSWSAQAGN